MPLPDPAAPVVTIDAGGREAASPEAELIVRWPYDTQLVARGPIPDSTLATILAAAASATSREP